jgi:16S rRNA (cytosine1402-N4)-methyltransferase
MVTEVLELLAPKPGELAVDCTLGYGGHAIELLPLLQPGGHLIGLDVDPIELPRTEARLRALGFGPEALSVRRTNFAGLPQVLASFHAAAGAAVAATRSAGADLILADLGVSSMHIDNPARGFSVKLAGPLDMRMNPTRGQPASALLQKLKPDGLALLLEENDEPHAATLASVLAGKFFAMTTDLAAAVRSALPRSNQTDSDLAVRRVFQALRIAVNDEFSALDSLLRNLPLCVNPGGRVGIITFHSGEDRRVKRAFESGLRHGAYLEIAREVIRPTADERNGNPRSAPAKLRWARR